MQQLVLKANRNMRRLFHVFLQFADVMDVFKKFIDLITSSSEALI